MLTRRQALGSIVYPTALAAFSPAMSYQPTRRAIGAAVEAALGLAPPEKKAPEEVARDESFWMQVQQAYTVDRSILNLNNGAVSPAPAIVQESHRRHWERANMCPARVLWQEQYKQVPTVIDRMAREFCCNPQELAITRNASESLQICQLGIDLNAGDEVLCCTQDYPRMLTAFHQRARRDGIVVNAITIPTPNESADVIVETYRQNITPKTRLMLVTHMINYTGYIMPVKQLVAMAREHNIPVIIDGAHALAHIDFKLCDLVCDYYGSSLHKWLCAPHGTGLLYVRREKIKSLWPMMAAEEALDQSISKFMEIGTYPAAPYLAISEALTFHQAIGSTNKQERLRYLRDYWFHKLRRNDKLRLYTSMTPGNSCGIATVRIEGVDSASLANYLWDKHRIMVSAIVHDEFNGIRISPNLYTTLQELDRFCEVMQSVMDSGIPA
jgi:isopenicillin-N epimerase